MPRSHGAWSPRPGTSPPRRPRARSRSAPSYLQEDNSPYLSSHKQKFPGQCRASSTESVTHFAEQINGNAPVLPHHRSDFLPPPYSGRAHRRRDLSCLCFRMYTLEISKAGYVRSYAAWRSAKYHRCRKMSHPIRKTCRSGQPETEKQLQVAVWVQHHTQSAMRILSN